MANKHLLAALVCLTIASALAHDRPHMARPSQANDHERQIFDAKTAFLKPAAMNAPEAGGPPAMTQDDTAAQRELLANQFDLDVPYLHTNFSTRDIDTLVATGRATFDFPDGSQQDMQLTGARTQFGIQHLRAEMADNVVTITRRNDHYFATVAHQADSYRIEGSDTAGRIYPHQQLAARTIIHEEDFRHVHAR